MIPKYEQLARDIEKYTSDFDCFQSTFHALNRIYFDIIKREENLQNRSLASLLDELLTRITTEFQTLSNPTEFVLRDNLDYSVKGVNLRFRWMQYILQETQTRLQVLLVQAQELLQKWWIDMAIIDPEKTVYEIPQPRKSTTQQECWDIFCEYINNLPVQENEKREEARRKKKTNRKDNTSPKRGYSPEKKRQETRTISEKRGGNTPPRRGHTETPTERYHRKEKERQRGGNTSPRRGHTETPTERYHRKEKENQKKKERLKELERDKHRARILAKIHQDMVKEREERERTHETAEAPNEEDPLLKKPQMANISDLLTQLHQCA